MYDILQGAPVYDIAVDPATLKLVSLAKGGAGCSVQLKGAIDSRWAEIFQRVRRESRILSRYELDCSTAIVGFVRGPGSDPADIMDALETLDAFVQRVSSIASGTSP